MRGRCFAGLLRFDELNGLIERHTLVSGAQEVHLYIRICKASGKDITDNKIGIVDVSLQVAGAFMFHYKLAHVCLAPQPGYE